MKLVRRWSGLIGALCLVGCQQAKPHGEAAALDAGATPSASSAAPVPSASPSSATTAPDAGAAVSAPNLLELVPSKIAVSSTVQNPRDFPEHLMDGRLETAWNGKTGDLVGGWIRFEVPADAKVDSVELTAGYSRVTDVDLFTANHRITKLRISHDGKPLREHTLDPNVRELQRIPIGTAGGTIELKVLETLPGSNPKWRELVVSELHVVGTPGKERRKQDEPPRIGVGRYDTFPPELPPERVDSPMPRFFPDLASLCAAWPAVARRDRAANDPQLGEMKWHEGTCTEEPVGVELTPDATYLGLAAVRLDNGYRAYSAPVVQTPAGFWLTGFEYHGEDPTDPGCPSIVRPFALEGRPSVHAGWLAMPTSNSRLAYDDSPNLPEDDDGMRAGLAKGLLFCKPAAGGLVCKAHHPQYQQALGYKVAPRSDRWAAKGWSHVPWTNETTFSIDAAGELRLR